MTTFTRLPTSYGLLGLLALETRHQLYKNVFHDSYRAGSATDYPTGHLSSQGLNLLLLSQPIRQEATEFLLYNCFCRYQIDFKCLFTTPTAITPLLEISPFKNIMNLDFDIVTAAAKQLYGPKFTKPDTNKNCKRVCQDSFDHFTGNQIKRKVCRIAFRSNLHTGYNFNPKSLFKTPLASAIKQFTGFQTLIFSATFSPDAIFPDAFAFGRQNYVAFTTLAVNELAKTLGPSQLIGDGASFAGGLETNTWVFKPWDNGPERKSAGAVDPGNVEQVVHAGDTS